MSYASERTIVVGVDGSDRSVDALEWAAAEARSADATVKVVTAWHFPDVLDHRPARAESDLSAALEDRVGELVAQTCSTVKHRTVIQEDCPVDLLLSEAQTADLVVVAGDGAETPRRVGPVILGLLQQAVCPVVVVPATDPTRPAHQETRLAGSAFPVRRAPLDLRTRRARVLVDTMPCDADAESLALVDEWPDVEDVRSEVGSSRSTVPESPDQDDPGLYAADWDDQMR